MVHIVLEVTCSFVTWLCLYCCFCHWNRQRSYKWSCRLVTLLHGLIVTCLSGYVMFLDGPWPLTHAGMFGISPSPVALSQMEVGADFLSSYTCVFRAKFCLILLLLFPPLLAIHPFIL